MEAEGKREERGKQLVRSTWMLMKKYSRRERRVCVRR